MICSTLAVSTGLSALLAWCRARAESVSFTLSFACGAAVLLADVPVDAWLALFSELLVASGSCGSPFDEMVVFIALGILLFDEPCERYRRPPGKL
ncbi:hypothetical protein GCM10007863_43670 [Dyella mobilis]|nr:hypothetical protein GCM10007863_43670 [Dyella mobilis]